jgi:hypothetical protein
VIFACDWSFFTKIDINDLLRMLYIVKSALAGMAAGRMGLGGYFPVYLDLPYQGGRVLFPLPERRVYGCSLGLRKES